MGRLRVTISGRELASVAGRTVIQAWLDAGLPLARGVGCMGQGVCGSCRAMVRRRGREDVRTELACETRVEDGMEVVFLEDLHTQPRHTYDLEAISDGWQLLERARTAFPEAARCRHCGGCDRACPKGIAVEAAVEAAVAGRMMDAARAFEPCIMCNLCTAVCPEQIAPNHLGVFLRRATTRLALLPSDLVQRLRQIEQGTMTLEIDAPGARPPSSEAPR